MPRFSATEIPPNLTGGAGGGIGPNPGLGLRPGGPITVRGKVLTGAPPRMGGPTSNLVPGEGTLRVPNAETPVMSGAKGVSAGMKGASCATMGNALRAMRLIALPMLENNPITVS